MKKYILPLVLIGIVNWAMAQHCGTVSGSGACTSPDTLTNFGFGTSYKQLPPIINGQPTDITLEYLTPDTVYSDSLGFVYSVNSIQFDTISNLPNGLCWSSSAVDDSFVALQDGCFRITGIACDTPGQYKLHMALMFNSIGFGGAVPLTGDYIGLYYYLRLNNAGEATIAIDTTQTDNDPIIKYGPAANCTAPSVIVSLGSGGAVCRNSILGLQATITYGVAPYHYNWSATGATLSCDTCSNPLVTITGSTTISVTVTDSRDSMAHTSVTYTVNSDTSHLTLALTNTGITCASSIDTTVATITGGVNPYKIIWGDGDIDTPVIVGTPGPSHNYYQATTYVISVSDTSNCIISKIDTVPSYLLAVSLAGATQPGCYGQTTGQIVVTATGGHPPYSYNWNTGNTGDTLAGIAEGTYTVTVTDTSVCSATFSYALNSVHDNSGFYLFLTPTISNCSNNGAIADTVYGGTSPFTYLWSNSATTVSISGLSGGNYSVTATDNLGCQTTGTAYVTTTCYSAISGQAFVDENSNCIFDGSDVPVTGIPVTAVDSADGNTYYGVTDNYGNWNIQVSETGTFNLYTDVYSTNCGNLTLCSNTHQSVHIAVLGDSSVNNKFVAQGGSQGFDLTLYVATTSANPGFQKEYDIYPADQSYSQYNGVATITFVYDTGLRYQFSTPVATTFDSATHTITWAVDSLSWLDTIDAPAIQSFFLVPSTFSTSGNLHSQFTITPVAGDCDTLNNHLSFTEEASGSHDPNAKAVSPSGGIAPDDDSVLTYTIYFQNNGTDSTHFIIVVDTLSPNLEPATVRNLAGSAKYSNFTISGTGILTWTFNPYHLPDSLTSLTGSKGFIMFSVKKKANLPIGATISNTASIYFDYNTPVVTNTISDTIAIPLVIYDVTNMNGVTVKAFPNPFANTTNIVVTGLNEKYDFSLFDVTGRLEQKILSINATQFEVNRDGLASGIYLYRITTGNTQIACGKLVVE